MDRTTVDSLLHKARALADYAVNTGQMPEDSRIFEEIDSIAQAVGRGENPAIAPLVAEMQKVCKKAKVTVEQLMRRETLLGRLSQRAALVTPYLVGFMTLLLTLYLAFQSSELHKADLALREYQDLESERLQEKIYDAWKMYHYEHVLNAKGSPLAELDRYQGLVDDSKRLYEKRSAVQELLLYSSVIRYFPKFFQYHGSTQPAAAVGSEAEASADSSELTKPELDCSKEPQEPLAPSANHKPAVFGSSIELDNYRQSIACFVQSLLIGEDYDYPMVSMIYQTRNKVNLLVSWMLPGLYGLLGACVFLMRELLVVNKVHGDARIVDLLSLLLRVALGGLAGIIVGWFWVPTSRIPGSSAIEVSSISFGVAFLAGFSIDSLFALLDRLLKNFRPSDGEKPAKATKRLEGEA
jgi:hypothetical protein